MSTQYSGPLTDIHGMVAGDVSDLSKSVPIAWPEAQRICDIPEVREALDKFAADAHEENMLAMVSAIMGHAVAQGRAAGLEEERAIPEEVKKALDRMCKPLHDSVLSGATAAADAYCMEVIRNYIMSTVSPTPSEAGKDDARDAELAELIAIGKNLLTQDNRCTDHPLFIVEQKRLIVGIDSEYANKIGWFDSDGMATPEEHEFLEKQYKKSRREPDGWTRTGYSEEWQFVTACFTEQGCKDYIRIDGHNLKEPRIYADGSYRNNEYRTVRNFLMQLAAKNDAALSSLEVIGNGGKG